MDRKKIVIISRTIFPLQAPRSFRATELAKELAKQGHQVILYAVLGKYDYSQFQQETNVSVKNIGKMIFATLNSDGRTKNGIFNKVMAKMFNKLLEFPDIELMFKIPKCLKKETDADLVITVAVPYPLHWGVALFKSFNKDRFKSTWIADCGDPYMGNKFHKRYFYFKYVEKWFCNKADFITVPLAEAITAYYPEFRDKIKVIPQGFDFNAVSLPTSNQLNTVPTFVYAGAFYKGVRDPDLFLKYLCTKSQDFKFVVYTKNKKALSQYVEALGDRLSINDYIPRNELLKVMKSSDFLVNFENGTAVQSPSKLIDYAIVDRPILSVNSLEIDSDKIDAFLEGNYSNRLIIKDIDQYRIENVAKKFVNLIKA